MQDGTLVALVFMAILYLPWFIGFTALSLYWLPRQIHRTATAKGRNALAWTAWYIVGLFVGTAIPTAILLFMASDTRNNK